jgi:hypothetical protein
MPQRERILVAGYGDEAGNGFLLSYAAERLVTIVTIVTIIIIAIATMIILIISVTIIIIIIAVVITTVITITIITINNHLLHGGKKRRSISIQMDKRELGESNLDAISYCFPPPPHDHDHDHDRDHLLLLLLKTIPIFLLPQTDNWKAPRRVATAVPYAALDLPLCRRTRSWALGIRPFVGARRRSVSTSSSQLKAVEIYHQID